MLTKQPEPPCVKYQVSATLIQTLHALFLMFSINGHLSIPFCRWGRWKSGNVSDILTEARGRPAGGIWVSPSSRSPPHPHLPTLHPTSILIPSFFQSSSTPLDFMVHPAHSPQKKRSDIKKILCNSQQPQKTAPSISSPSEFTQYNPMNCPKNVSLTGLFNKGLCLYKQRMEENTMML